MNKKDLDALNELYSSVYSDPEQLNEGNPYANTPDSQLTSNELLKKRNPNYGKPSPQQVAQAQGAKKALEQGKQIGMSGGPFGTNQARLKLDSNATKSSGRSTLRATPDTGVTPASMERSIRVGGKAYDRLTTRNGVNYVERKSPAPATRPASAPTTRPASAPTTRPASAPTTRPASAPATRPAASTSPGTPKTAPTKPTGSPMDQWRKANPTLAAAADEKARIRGTQQTDNPGMADMRSKLPMNSPSVQSPAVAKLANKPTTLAGNQSLVNNPNAIKAAPPKPATPTEAPKRETQLFSYQWPSAKTIREIAGAYSSIYEAKKKVDQDQDGDNDFADVRVARMIASGVPKAKAIAMVKDKSYNEEVELWVNELLEEGYDLSEYTWEDMFDIYLDEGIGSAIRGLFSKKKEEEAPKPQSRGDQLRARYNVGPEKSDTSAKRQIINRAKDNFERAQRQVDMGNAPQSYADKAKEAHNSYLKAGYSKYGADLPYAGRGNKARKRAAAMTPREIKEAYETYEFVASYLLENNFANTIEDANVIINNMSEGWFESIIEEKKPLPVAKMKNKESKLLDNEEGHLQALRTDVGSKERKARMKELQRFDNINSVRTSVAKRGGKQQHSMPEIGRYKPKDED